MCAWEVKEAVRFGKRIIPVLCRPLNGAAPTLQLSDLNYIIFCADPKSPDSGFGTGLTRLVSALNTDLDWLREHTRLLQRSIEWDVGGRPVNRLLSGNDIGEAKTWATGRPKDAPEPTILHLDFIRASEGEEVARSSAQRQQLDAMAASNAERAKALSQVGAALKHAALEQRRRATLRNIAFLAVSLVAALAGWQWWRAEGQREEADAQKQLAEAAKTKAVAVLGSATTLIVSVQSKFDDKAWNDARDVFKMGAELGDANAMGNLGRSYANGLGGPRDYTKAREWYEKAEKKGDAGSMYALGLLYANGWGVPQDYGKAREWYKKAVEKGDADGMYPLGLLYDNGWGVPQDYAKAREWYEKAAEKGNVSAMNNLGVLYHNGEEGVPQDFAKAREWFEQAAEKGIAIAMTNLGVLFVNGRGVPQDYAKAREWYEKAAAKGDADAAETEAAETKSAGKPGKETASALVSVAWLALFPRDSRDYARSLAASDHSLTLRPGYLPAEVNRAHALMFLGRRAEARTLYLQFKGQQLSDTDNRLWERVIAHDFAVFRKVGPAHPMMAEIDAALGVSK
jgi:TPR repeat protein